jgi:hypothetical protein
VTILGPGIGISTQHRTSRMTNQREHISDRINACLISTSTVRSAGDLIQRFLVTNLLASA